MSQTIHQKDISSFQKFSLQEGAKHYTDLRQEVIGKGLLNRSFGYYFVLTFFTYMGFIAAFVGVYFSHNPFVLALLSVTFAIFSVQIAGIIHDAGHRAVFKSPENNDLFGQILALTVGTGYGNWRISHDRHHANPNQDGFDPDIEVPFSFTPERIKNSTGLARLIAKNQAYLYYPLGVFTSLSLRFKKMTYFQENWGTKIYTEVALFAIAAAAHFIVPLLAFGLLKGAGFLLIVTMVESFYLFNVFAPNHKGMPEIGKDIKLSFFEHQIVTARNIPHSDVIDFIYLGLNLQIEHHLFPNCPRNNLKKVVPIVKKYCERYGLEYIETGAIESNLIIFNEMRAVSQQYAQL